MSFPVRRLFIVMGYAFFAGLCDDRQLGFYTGGDDDDASGQESDSDEDAGQPDTASIARQVRERFSTVRTALR